MLALRGPSFLLGTLALSLLIATGGCSGGKDSADAVVTTITPTGNNASPQAFISPSRVRALEQLPTEEAASTARDLGWQTIVIAPLADKGTGPDKPAIYQSNTVGLYETNGQVIEAWSGG